MRLVVIFMTRPEGVFPYPPVVAYLYATPSLAVTLTQGEPKLVSVI